MACEGCNRGDDPELLEAGDVHRVDDLGMLVPPARLLHFALVLGNFLHRAFIQIERQPVRPVPDGMGLT
jgi:hypothetical protein